MHLTVYLPAPARRLLEAEQLADESASIPSGVRNANAWVSRLTVRALLEPGTVGRLVLDILSHADGPLTEAEVTARVVEQQGRRKLTPERAAIVVHNVLRAFSDTARTWEPFIESVRIDGVERFRILPIPD